MKHLYVTKIIYIDAQNILKIYIKNFFPSDGRGRVNEQFFKVGLSGRHRVTGASAWC